MSLFTCFEREGGKDDMWGPSIYKYLGYTVHVGLHISTVKSWGKVWPILHESIYTRACCRHRGLFWGVSLAERAEGYL